VIPDVAGLRPPHDLDAEAAVLAALLLSSQAFADVGGWLTHAHFYSAANGWIYRAIEAIDADQGRIDIVAVASWLDDRTKLAQVGGRLYLAQLVDATPAVAHVADHALIVVTKAKARAVIARCQRGAAEGYTAADVDEWSGEVVADLARLADDGVEEVGVTGCEAGREICARFINPDPVPPMGTGIPELDRKIRGLRPKHLIVIGSHSGIGKSALAANIATHVLLNERREDRPSGVLIFSLEMGPDEYLERMACSRGRFNSRWLDPEYRGELLEDDARRFSVALNDVSRPNLRIDDNADITIAQIRTKARRVAAQFKRAGTPLRLIVIDYAQIVSAGSETRRRSENREQEVAAIGRESKKMAKELDLPVLLLAQLNDDAAKEKGPDGKPRKPRAKDLRESKALLQDANAVILIHNPSAIARAEAYADAAHSDPTDADEVDLIIGKVRHGAPGTIRARYWPAFTLFGSAYGAG
jgi:replicative DNA helicase